VDFDTPGFSLISTFRFDGQGTTTSGATLAPFVILVLIFVVSFAVGRRPKGNRPFSRPWLKEWLAAALPRITIACTPGARLLSGLDHHQRSPGGGMGRLQFSAQAHHVTAGDEGASG